MSITGYAHFASNPRIVTADRVFWESYCRRNISEITKLIVETSKELKCVCCGDYTLNYKTKGSLFHHYKFHLEQTIQYYLERLILKPLCELLNNTNQISQTEIAGVFLQ